MPSLGPTIGLFSPGAMGSAVAYRLTSHGYTVLTSLAGRSDASKERARKAGMKDASVEEIAQRSRYVLSILPPSEAVSFAQRFASILGVKPRTPAASPADSGEGDRPPHIPLIFADCNAVSPTTVRQIGAFFSPDVFVDGCIIGGPPSAPSATPAYDPTFYASGAEAAVEGFANVMREGGLKISTLQAGVGDASALKMGYAVRAGFECLQSGWVFIRASQGISKGLTGLMTAMILATHASSPATSEALMHELSLSQPVLLQRATRSIPDMLPKAYRFVGEMEEIRDFVNAGVEGGSSDTWEGLARVYERVAGSVKEGGEDMKVLEKFVEDSKETLRKK